MSSRYRKVSVWLKSNELNAAEWVLAASLGWPPHGSWQD